MTKDKIQINQHINIECSNYNKLLTIFFALMPIIYSQPFYYNSSPGFITGIFLIILFTVDIGNKKNDLIYKFDKYYFLFIVYIVFNSLLLALNNKQYLNLSNLFKGNIAFVIYFGLVVIFSAKINFNFFLKIYKYICIAIIFGLIIQTIFFYIFQKRLEIIFDTGFIKLFHGSCFGFYRPSFIFREPSHLIYYLIPLLFYELILKNNIIFSLFAYFHRNFVRNFKFWIYFSCNNMAIKCFWIIKKKKNFVEIIILFLAIIFIILFSLSFAGSKAAISRTVEGGSIYFRFYRGFIVYNNLTLRYKLTGVWIIKFIWILSHVRIRRNNYWW